MIRTFYHRLINTVLLLLAISIGIVYLLQNDHLEQLKLRELAAAKLNQLNGTQSNNGSGINGYTNPTDGTLWAESAFGGLLERDPVSWLPKDAKSGGTLKLLISSDPKGFNYLIESSVDVSNIRSYNQVPLVARHKKAVTKYGPGLATYLQRSDDFLTYRYRLRPDIFWHQPALSENETFDWLLKGKSCTDVGRRTAASLKKTGMVSNETPLAADRHWVNGRCRVTAHDVVFWLRMMMNTQIAGAASKRAYFKNLDFDKVRVTGDFSFEIGYTTKSYKNDLMSRFLQTLPEFLYAYDAEGNRFEEAVIGKQFSEHWYNPRALGNGAYRFVEFRPGEVIRLEKDPWFPLGGNSFDEVVIKVVKERVQHPLMLLKSAESKNEATNQGVHMTTLSSQNFRMVMKQNDKNKPFHDGRIQHDFYWTYGYSYIGWNNAKPFFSDKRVRRAMSYALKADDILKQVRFGLGERTTGPITPGLPHYDDSLKPIPFDLDMSKKLLTEAGWTDSNGNGIRDKLINGQRIEFEFVFNIVNSPTHQDTAEILKEELKKVGVKCTLKAMEWAMFQKELQSKKFDAVMLGWGTSPNVDFDQIWHSRHAETPKSSNFISFKNAEADRIIEQMEAEFDMEKRYQLAKAFHRLIYDEQPYTFLFRSKVPYFWTKQLKNAKEVSLVSPYANFRSWYLNRP